MGLGGHGRLREGGWEWKQWSRRNAGFYTSSSRRGVLVVLFGLISLGLGFWVLLSTAGLFRSGGKVVVDVFKDMSSLILCICFSIYDMRLISINLYI